MHAVNTTGRVSIDSGALSLAFGTARGRVALESLRDSTGREWVCAPNPGDSLWRVTLLGPDGTETTIAASEAELVEAESESIALEFTWRFAVSESRFQVRMTVVLEPDDPLSHWSLAVDLPDGWKVSQSDFPLIPNIAHRRGLKLAAPFGWGVEYPVKPGLAYSSVYPSCVATMQFLAFYSGGRGLYLAAHDPTASHKSFGASADERSAEFRCTDLPAITPKGGGTYTAPCAFTVGVFAGDYYDAARIYREFTLTTRWGSAGNVADRPIAQWLKDTDLWLRPDGSPADNVEITKQAIEFFKLPLALHWYRYHQIPYDTLYPEYFPPLPGFEDGIREFQRLGARVIPYINGRLCDPNSTTWTDERGSESAARDRDGSPYTEVYGSKVPLNVMCPATSQWQDKIAGLVGRFSTECGTDGIYIDQITCAHAVRCFRADHGHLPGGGTFWVEGYRKMLEMARAKLRPDQIITSEENAECWIDQFDALLLVNSPVDRKIIPLFPAVYAGRTINHGFQYYPPTDLELSLPFRLKTARCFIFGSQLGWIQPWRIMRPEHRAEAEFLKDLARCRRFAREFVTHGDFLGLVPVRGDNPRIKGRADGFFSGSYHIDTPAVLASAWIARDGRLGIVLANISDTNRRVTLRLPLAKANLRASDTLTIKTFGPEGLISTSESKGAALEVTVPGAGAVVLAIGRGT